MKLYKVIANRINLWKEKTDFSLDEFLLEWVLFMPFTLFVFSIMAIMLGCVTTLPILLVFSIFQGTHVTIPTILVVIWFLIHLRLSFYIVNYNSIKNKI